MLYDIKDKLIKEIYLPHFQYLKDTYIVESQKFFDGVDAKCRPYREIINKRVQEHKGDQDYCECFEIESQIISNYDDLKYHYLSSVLQSIVSLWENQLQDFCLLENCKDYNEIKTHLKVYYDLDSDNEINEIRQVYNYLKHGANGNAEKNLIKMNSRFYRHDGYSGEIRGNYYMSKQLNLDLTDIEFFADAFIRFWTEVYDRIEQAEKQRKD